MNSWKNVERCIKLAFASRGMEVQTERITEGPTLMTFAVSMPHEAPDGAFAGMEAELGSMAEMKGARVTMDKKEGLILIEVPKSEEKRETVTLTEMIEACKKRTNANAFYLPVGKDTEGKPVVCDLTRLRHLLVAGAEGTGKSTFLDAAVCSFIARYTPEQVRLILCESEAGDFRAYEGVPHLLTGKNVTGRNILDAIGWACIEVRRRLHLFEEKCESGVRTLNICEYNENLAEGETPLPYIVVLIDDCSEIMAIERRNTSYCMTQLFHMSRATGVHLIFATEDPSEKAYKDGIASDLLSCAVLRMDGGNSRTLTGSTEAENLLGRGDLLLRSAGSRGCRRIQGVSVTEAERAAVIEAAKANYEPRFDREAERIIDGEEDEE